MISLPKPIFNVSSMKCSEYSKLIINTSLDIDSRLLWKEAVGGNTPEHLMHEYAQVVAYPQGHTVNEAYSGTFAKQRLLDEDCHLPLQFHKPVIGNRMGKQGVKGLAEIICQTKGEFY